MFPPPDPSSSAVSKRPDDVLAQHAQREGRLVGVVRGRRQEMEPGRQLLAVEVGAYPGRASVHRTRPARSPASIAPCRRNHSQRRDAGGRERPDRGRSCRPPGWSTTSTTPTSGIVHVSPDRRVYNKRHIPGATYSDLHKELALKGTAPETGDAEREWLIPTREETERLLRTLAGRRGRPDRLLRRRRHEPPGDPRLLAAAPVSVPGRPRAHPRRRDRGLAARRRRDDHRTARGRPGRRAARAGRARRTRRRASSRPTTRSSPGAARRPSRTARPGSSTSGRPPSGSARTCGRSAAATSRAPASAASSTC